MIRANINLGQTYACCTNPRKGIDDLSTIDAAFPVYVIDTSHARWVESTGQQKLDGVLVKRLQDPAKPVLLSDDPFVVKPRDILMLWNDYNFQRAQRTQKQREAEEQRKNQLLALHARRDAIAKKLMDEYGLTDAHGDDRDYVLYNFYSPNEREPAIGLTLQGAEKLLDGISERVYRILSEQE